jgi:hypothetical protein
MWGATSQSRGTRRALFSSCLALSLALGLGLGSGIVTAEPKISADVAARLTPEQLLAYRAHLTARTGFDRQLDMYWALIEERRDNRRRKRAKALAFDATDYVAQQPPKYLGPPLPPDVAKIITDLRPPEPDKPQPIVADYMAAAQAQFNFAPALTTERDFKRRYAIEALSAGLTKLQVVRVYALETGGNGTYDMQAGFDPLTRQGRAISSALGYAQLLAANSTSELVRYGGDFIQRLETMAAQPGMHPQHIQHWQWKAGVLRQMLQAAKSIPNEWSAHRRFAMTAPGLGIHTLNMDADVGPWLQALKLKGLLQTAAQEAGRTTLSGGELEMMNLAGPRSGLELLSDVGQAVPTANVFERDGYYRNTIVREKTGAELLKALDDRMDISIKRPGAVEFLAVFDEVLAGSAGRSARAAAVDKPAPIVDALGQQR